jgi:DNA polymerase II large subunit
LRPSQLVIDNLIHPSARNKHNGNVRNIPLRRNAKARYQAEVLVFLSAVQAATQLVEQALRVLIRLRKAHDRQKALVDVLAHHEGELGSVKAIIGIIDDEEELQTASVAAELVRLREVQSKLVKLLEELDPKRKGAARQFVRQLTKGSSDESKLSVIMTELGQVKTMLLLRIQVANVGVTHNMEKRLVANTEVIERVDQFLREVIGDCKGLRIARLLKGRLPSSK